MSEKRLATIQELKDVVKAIADTEKLASELTVGFSFQELGELITVANDLPALVKDKSVLLPEYAALDDAGRAELVAYAQANCKFPSNVSVEAWVAKVVSAAVLLSKIYQTLAA